MQTIHAKRRSLDIIRPAPALLRGGKGNQRGRVLAFMGAKGGVGTTTVAINVAAALAVAGHDVIAVELRPWSGTFAQHCRPLGTVGNLSELFDLAPEFMVESAVRSRLWSFPVGLKVLFGPQTPEESKKVSADQAETLVGLLAEMAQYIVLDLPCFPSEANRAAISRCDFAGLVMEREPGCIAPAKLSLELLKTWTKSRVLTGTIAVTRVPLACPVSLNEIVFQLGRGIIAVIPPAADVCVLAQKSGAPVVFSQPENMLTASFTELAGRLTATDFANLSWPVSLLG
jgi:pilus assembly protein CpaE